MAERVYKTKKNLQTVWNQLDEALGNIDNATYSLACMSDIPKDVQDVVDRIDTGQLIIVRDTIGKLLEEKEK